MIKVCTKENPFVDVPVAHIGGYEKIRWSHPDAVEIGEDYGKGGGVADGDYVTYKCPNCGKVFTVELPN